MTNQDSPRKNHGLLSTPSRVAEECVGPGSRANEPRNGVLDGWPASSGLRVRRMSERASNLDNKSSNRAIGISPVQWISQAQGFERQRRAVTPSLPRPERNDSVRSDVLLVDELSESVFVAESNLADQAEC